MNDKVLRRLFGRRHVSIFGVLAILFIALLRLSAPSQNYPKSQLSPMIAPSLTLEPALVGSRSDAIWSASTTHAIVKRVIDGDTVELTSGHKVRYIGINAPESVDPRREVQCFGHEASRENRRLVEGKTVRLEKDISETDRYGRLLRYVYIDDIMVNEVLVKEGFAHASTYPPDVKYSELFRLGEQYARDYVLGLWARCPVVR